MKRNIYLIDTFLTNYSTASYSIYRKVILASFLLLFSFVGSRSFAQSGQALDLDGANDYVQLPPILSGSYTKEAWINTNNVFASGNNILSGTNEAFYSFNGVLSAGHEPNYTIVQDTTAVPLSANTWYHVAVTYDATTGDMKIYKDGVLVGRGTGATPYVDAALYIGGFQANYTWSGKMDEVRIWNTVRTAADIATYKDSSLTGDEPGLLAYYKFDQGIAGDDNTSITSVTDSSDKCSIYNGTLVNFASNGPTSNWVAPGAPLTGAATNVYANIGVAGNATCIIAGDNTPSTSDSTDFGIYVADSIVVNYLITNSGGVDLSLSSAIGGADPASFTIVSEPTTITPGSSGILQVKFSPTGGRGVKTAIITITNNDQDEGTFTFAITGNYVGPGISLNFDGTNDYVRLPFVLSGSYTKEAWVKAAVPSIIGNIISGTDEAFDAINGVLTTGHAAPFYNSVTDSTGAQLAAGTWYHVAVTYDVNTDSMYLYKNGIMVGRGLSGNPGYGDTSLYIGAFQANYTWNGTIDEVRIWDTVRTAAQINTYKDSTLTGDEYGLFAYYDFKNGLAGATNTGVNTLYDLSKKCSAYNGALINFANTGAISNWIADTPTTAKSLLMYPNISVSGNSFCITTPDTATSIVDNTDFGVANGSPISKTFIIQNNGSETLLIDSIHISGADSSEFAITAAPAASLLPGGSTSFTVQFTPTSNGYRSAAINIYNNDGDEAPFVFAISTTAVLPVTWQSFDGRVDGTVAQLSWKTTAEINSKGYEVLRSADGGSSWQKIGSVSANTTSQVNTYSFTDPSPVSGVNLYRLKQVDIDGNYGFSRIEALTFNTKGSAITVYPNPVKDKATLLLANNKLLNTQVRLTTVTGKVLATINLTNTSQQIDLSNYSKGVYFISFSNGETKKIIKQ